MGIIQGKFAEKDFFNVQVLKLGLNLIRQAPTKLLGITRSGSGNNGDHYADNEVDEGLEEEEDDLSDWEREIGEEGHLFYLLPFTEEELQSQFSSPAHPTASPQKKVQRKASNPGQ